MIGPNNIYDIIIVNAYWIDKINKKIKIKFLCNILKKLIETKVKYNLIGLLEGYSIERILYDFAVFSYYLNLESNKINYIRKYIDEKGYNPDLFGIEYKVLSDSKDRVTGIFMVIWTEDRMAKLNLELSIEFGSLKLNVEWMYKNDQGFFETYGRIDPILNSRKEIKEILIDYISRYCLYFLYYCEKISPSR